MSSKRTHKTSAVDVTTFSPSAKPPTPITRRASALAILRSGEEPSRATLEELGFHNYEGLLQSVANQLKLPRLGIDSIELGPGLAELIPRNLAEKHHIVPIFASEGELTIATHDPARIELFDWMQQDLRREVIVVVASRAEIGRAIARLYKTHSLQITPAEREEQAVSPKALLEATPVVDKIISRALELRASDIHLEATAVGTFVRYRVDGMLSNGDCLPAELHLALVSRMKIMAELDIAERQLPQDGRVKIQRPDSGEIDMRVSTLPTYFGEKVCCRILNNARAALSLTDLGFEDEQLEMFERLIRQPCGLLLVAGPTGSGKSTTLYSALNAIRSPELNIVSVEDPIEYQLPGINQVQVNPKRGLTFATALRSIVRQDPNVVLVGEIRDPETGAIAAQAAMTGQLVLSSLHTNDAPSTVSRLVDIGIDPYLVAATLVGVVAQRLVRTICDDCKDEYEPSEAELAALGIPNLKPGTTFARGKGCEACLMTGYSGRIAVREIMEVGEPIRRAIGRGADADELRGEAVKHGFRSMRFEGLRKLFAGVTTSEEVLRLTRS